MIVTMNPFIHSSLSRSIQRSSGFKIPNQQARLDTIRRSLPRSTLYSLSDVYNGPQNLDKELRYILVKNLGGQNGKFKEKKHAPSSKAKIALEAIKEDKTSAELASQYQIHQAQIRAWKAIAKNDLVDLFADHKRNKGHDIEELIQEIYR